MLSSGQLRACPHLSSSVYSAPLYILVLSCIVSISLDRCYAFLILNKLGLKVDHKRAPHSRRSRHDLSSQHKTTEINTLAFLAASFWVSEVDLTLDFSVNITKTVSFHTCNTPCYNTIS